MKSITERPACVLLQRKVNQHHCPDYTHSAQKQP